MTARERLPNRRRNESFEFSEIFLSAHRVGSPIEAIARDAAVVTSIALQSGASLETIRAALTKDHGGPATPLGAVLDAIAEGGTP